MPAAHASLTDIPDADVPYTDAKWTPVRKHFRIEVTPAERAELAAVGPSANPA